MRISDWSSDVCSSDLGHPMTAHWGIEDPAAVEGDDQREAFMQALRYLQNRISLFLALPLASLDEMAMRRKLREIGQSEGASVRAGARSEERSWRERGGRYV